MGSDSAAYTACVIGAYPSRFVRSRGVEQPSDCDGIANCNSVHGCRILASNGTGAGTGSRKAGAVGDRAVVAVPTCLAVVLSNNPAYARSSDVRRYRQAGVVDAIFDAPESACV